MARLPPLRHRIAPVVITLLVVAGCRPDTVDASFEPVVGDRFEFTSTVSETVRTRIGDTVDVSTGDSHIRTLEEVVAVGAGPRAEVTVQRDGTTARTFSSGLDRAGRATALDLGRGVAAGELGIDLGAGVPAGALDPPPGPLRPGQVWAIGDDRGPGPRGHGRVVGVSVEDGVALVETRVRLRVVIRGEVATPDGPVALDGDQVVAATTHRRVDDGVVWRERTEVEGTVDALVRPPLGVDAVPVTGRIDYVITTVTRRIP